MLIFFTLKCSDAYMYNISVLIYASINTDICYKNCFKVGIVHVLTTSNAVIKGK